MRTIEDILERLVLVGGPPRSGTTFAAKSLNAHPHLVTAIDDHVYECWALYYYRTRVGLVQDIRVHPREIDREEVNRRLREHLVSGDRLAGVAPSLKTGDCPSAVLPVRPDADAIQADFKLSRCMFPLERFGEDWRLCLKSPEISYVLPELASFLPGVNFVLVYRPVIEIAESMYRKGLTVKKVSVFHKRWDGERDESGRLVPPPGVPGEWFGLWREVSDFQRCVIYAVCYLRAMVEGVKRVPGERVFVYDHARMRESPGEVFGELASFLGMDESGFRPAIEGLKVEVPEISMELIDSLKEMEEVLGIKEIMKELARL